MNRKPAVKWRDIFPVEAYAAAKMGLSDPKIAVLHGLTPRGLAKWKVEHPVLKQALDMARSNVVKGCAERFEEYIHQRLTPELQDLWKRLMLWKDHHNARGKVEMVLAGEKKLVRQQLLIHALIYTNYNVSEAARIVNVPLRTYRDWKATDPLFVKLLVQIEEFKKDYFENALINLVVAGHSTAIIFVNRTYNKDRGYSEKFAAKDAKKNSAQDSIIPVEELDLSLETRREILTAFRAYKVKTKAGHPVC